VQLPVPPMQPAVHRPICAVEPSTAGLSSSRSMRDTFEDVPHDDDDNDAGAAGQEEIGPSQL
jgi:hypothetical protein